jgi:hypothetical protein
MNRRHLVPFLPLVIAPMVLGAAPRPARADDPPPFIKGMALGLFFDAAAQEHLSMSDMLSEIHDTGADYVSFVVSWYQDDVRSATVQPYADGDQRDARIDTLIQQAHDRGLKVFLFPIDDVQIRKPLEWRGTLKPPDFNVWWASYTKFIEHYADLAAKDHVELLSVGSELVTTEGLRDTWLSLIKDVRGRYNGPLIYSANWDHYSEVSFWDALDYVGLTGYYQLSTSNEPTLDELKQSWQAQHDTLVSWQKTVGKPMVFTEIGYCSQDGAASHPWDYTRGEPVDLEEQYLCYEAFYEVWNAEPALGGVFFWNWFGVGGADDGSYTPKKKPAEKVVRRWYGGDITESAGE